ncbi:hypothetical protein SAMN05443579_11793 [Variovorax sp. PDC80]|nr:hypothetical protein SAMN05443579_11793 [Variovorax sp. PDC80]
MGGRPTSVDASRPERDSIQGQSSVWLPIQGLVLASLLAGMAAAVIGLQRLDWARHSVVSWDALRPYAILIGGGALATEAIARWLRIHRFAALGAIVVAGALFCGAIWPLAAALAFVLSSCVIGRGLLRLAKVPLPYQEPVGCFLVGAAVGGTIVGLWAWLPLNYPGVYALGLAVPLTIGRRSALEMLGALRRAAAMHAGSGGFVQLLIAGTVLAHFALALMPEIGHDALATHLFIPTQLLERRAWGFDIGTYAWALLPMLGDWMFAIGHMLAGERGARLINLCFILASAFVVRDMALWAGASVRCARWSSLLFLCTPLALLETSSLYIESVWTAFAAAGVLALLRVVGRERDGALAAGVLLGAALAAKAITLTLLPALLLLFLAGFRGWGHRKALRPVALGVGAMALIGGLPYAVAWARTGNPMFPYLNQVFKSPLWSTLPFEDPRWTKGLHWNALQDITFNSVKFLEAQPGASGFQWLILLVPCLLLLAWQRRWRALALVLVGLSSIVLTFHSIAYLRYVFPAFVCLAAAFGVAMTAGVGPAMAVPMRWAFGFAAVAVIGLNLVFIRSATYYGDIALKPLLSEEGRDSYLAEWLPIRNAVELANRLNVHRSPVAFFSDLLAAGLNSDALHVSWYNRGFEADVVAADTVDKLGQVLARRSVDYLILDAHWKTRAQRDRVEAASDLVLSFGDVALRKLKTDYRFSTELLKNTDFSTGEGWTFTRPEQRQARERVVVTVSTPGTQRVEVSPGRRYRLAVTAECSGAPTQGRLQVNWEDKSQRFLSASIRLFTCEDRSQTHVWELQPPAGAAAGSVFATSHTEAPITVTGVSFRE